MNALMDKRGNNFTLTMKKYWKYFLGIAVTFLLLGYLILKSNPEDIFKGLQNANGYFILISIGLMLILFTIKTIRWQIILAAQGIKIRFFDALYLVLIGAFGSSITPAKIGDVLRAYYLTKSNEEIKIGLSVFSVVFDRILDLAGIFILMVFGVPYIIISFGWGNIDHWLLIALGIGFFVFVVVIAFVFSKKVGKKVLNFIIKFISKMFKKQEVKDKINLTSQDIIDDFYNHQKKYQLKHYLILGLISMIFWIILGIQGCFLLKGFNVSFGNIVDDSFVIITAICFAAIVAMAIPISLSGVGVRDFVLVYLLSYILGFAEAEIVSFSILQTFLNVFLPGLIGGILILLSSKILQWQKDRLKRTPA